MRKLLLVIFFCPIIGFSQTELQNVYDFKFDFGFAIHEGASETGLGVIGMFGLQKSYGKKQKIRLNSNFSLGRFSSIFIYDVPSQAYTYSSFDFIFHYDLLKYKAFSIVTSVGGYVTITGGKVEKFYTKEGNLYEGYKFIHPYLMASFSGGLRVAPKKSKLAFEVIPFHIQFGTTYSYLGMLKIGIDYKIYK